MKLVLLMITAYLVGSIPFAIIVARLLKLPDPSAHGSNNPGATNMVRIGGKKAGILTFLGDGLKGFIFITLLTTVLPLYHYRPDEVQAINSISAIFLVLGHIYSVFLRFKGGKGVATALGVIFALKPILGLLLACTWVIAFALFRISGLAAIIAAIALPFYSYYLYQNSFIFGTTLILSVLVLFRHKSNIMHMLKLR